MCRGGNTYIDSGKVLSLRMTFREPNTKKVFHTMETGVLNIQKKLTFIWGAIAPFKLGLKVGGVLESSGSQL